MQFSLDEGHSKDPKVGRKASAVESGQDFKCCFFNDLWNFGSGCLGGTRRVSGFLFCEVFFQSVHRSIQNQLAVGAARQMPLDLFGDRSREFSL
jgi:hypothetical protein